MRTMETLYGVVFQSLKDISLDIWSGDPVVKQIAENNIMRETML